MLVTNNNLQAKGKETKRMEEKNLMHVYVTYDRDRYTRVTIPADINEVQLKACLRDLGYISSFRRSYVTTKVYLENDQKTTLTEICTGDYRSLKELGIVENSLIVIKEGEPEPRPKREVVYRRDPMSIKCLYGCPMAASVEEAMNQAEAYKEEDSITTTGSISELE